MDFWRTKTIPLVRANGRDLSKVAGAGWTTRNDIRVSKDRACLYGNN